MGMREVVEASRVVRLVLHDSPKAEHTAQKQGRQTQLVMRCVAKLRANQRR
jgi:hypothetical protein